MNIKRKNLCCCCSTPYAHKCLTGIGGVYILLDTYTRCTQQRFFFFLNPPDVLTQRYHHYLYLSSKEVGLFMIIFLEDVRFYIPNHAGSEKGIYCYKIYTCPLIYRLLRKSDSCCRYQTYSLLTFGYKLISPILSRESFHMGVVLTSCLIS